MTKMHLMKQLLIYHVFVIVNHVFYSFYRAYITSETAESSLERLVRASKSALSSSKSSKIASPDRRYVGLLILTFVVPKMLT